ncbi:secondary thiamine-phosphate synthase enzyme YjbQ [uncultured Methanomethylovorans sp.]|jgi:secondary thiamine-phosphate synthase enzyme|uniref:secondary thiamine-phosphate synthase enzyme YjbQ n=1 Tax=uncultured Methanomethylovorans sp. TaxID=183759 RepID=UPI002AA6F84F|nr:secondary thiamine-phosphate synthase enzyme YjbQ [uncultured Methanomethylovorans sp.]
MKICTNLAVELIDITDDVLAEVNKSSIKDGICIVSTTHTTTAIIINENEPGLLSDMFNLLNKLVPPGAGYNHDRIDNNAHSHLRAMLLGSSETIPIVDGKLVLGMWQRIFFVELDGPRQRNVNVTLLASNSRIMS